MKPQAYDKVLLHKAKVIERYVARAREEYKATQGQFLTDHTRQDAEVLNLQRACEAAPDMAKRVVSMQGWGIAETSKDPFATLQRHNVLQAALAKTLTNMVGFRDLAAHDYEELNYDFVGLIITKDCHDLLFFQSEWSDNFLTSKASF